jgi:hypothetical protein
MNCDELRLLLKKNRIETTFLQAQFDDLEDTHQDHMYDEVAAAAESGNLEKVKQIEIRHVDVMPPSEEATWIFSNI